MKAHLVSLVFLLLGVVSAGPIRRDPEALQPSNYQAKRWVVTPINSISKREQHEQSTAAAGSVFAAPSHQGTEDGAVPAVGVGDGNSALLSFLTQTTSVAGAAQVTGEATQSQVSPTAAAPEVIPVSEAPATAADVTGVQGADALPTATRQTCADGSQVVAPAATAASMATTVAVTSGISAAVPSVSTTVSAPGTLSQQEMSQVAPSSIDPTGDKTATSPDATESLAHSTAAVATASDNQSIATIPPELISAAESVQASVAAASSDGATDAAATVTVTVTAQGDPNSETVAAPTMSSATQSVDDAAVTAIVPVLSAQAGQPGDVVTVDIASLVNSVANTDTATASLQTVESALASSTSPADTVAKASVATEAASLKQTDLQPPTSVATLASTAAPPASSNAAPPPAASAPNGPPPNNALTLGVTGNAFGAVAASAQTATAPIPPAENVSIPVAVQSQSQKAKQAGGDRQSTTAAVLVAGANTQTLGVEVVPVTLAAV